MRRATEKRYIQRHPDKRKVIKKDAKLRALGFAKGEYQEALLLQGNRCAICAVDFASISSRQVCADHDHATGQARGVLCNNCNTAIGMLKDSPERLLAAVRYLEHPPLSLV
ncbi:MAG: endonuclease domain-containing protein [Deltaproteobacteria bacterium]|nr:endonuclease domain-containing protein [Deltaproteobacteria bacterium]